MNYFWSIIVGCFVGVWSDKSEGIIVGGIIGYLFMQLLNFKNKISRLESRLDQQRIKLSKVQLDHPQTECSESEASPKALNPEEQVCQDLTEESFQKSEFDLGANLATLKEKILNDEVSIFKEKIPKDEVPVINEENNAIDPPRQPYVSAFTTEHYTTRPTDSVESKDQSSPSNFELKLGQLKSLVIGYFTGGNAMIRVGMLVLFIGVAFLLKYVAVRTVVPVEYRYVGIVLACLLMFFLGWKLRKKRPSFALSLEGGGIGLLYLTLFAALRLHGLMPPYVVLILLIAIVVFSALLAIIEDSLALAVISMIGGFAAPILTSSGAGAYVQLFSYYLLLNVGVFVIAWFKSWRLLNVLGFVATFGIGSLWGYQYYIPENFSSVEPFLITYFLLYTFIAILFALKQPPKLRGINDGTIVFGTPLVGFTLQAALMQDSEYGLAYSALALGLFYLALSGLVKSMNKPFMKNLIESFLALGVGFATLAIPLAFDGRVTSAMWVVEGSALFWVGIRQSRSLARLSGYALTVLGSVAYFVDGDSIAVVRPWLNANYIGLLMMVAATAFISLYSRVKSTEIFKIEVTLIPSLMMFSSVIGWIYAGLVEINFYPQGTHFILNEAFLASSCFCLLFIGHRIHFNLMKGMALAVSVFMLFNVGQPMIEVNRLNFGFFNLRFFGFIIMAITHLLLSWYWCCEKRHQWSKSYHFLAWIFVFSGLFIWVITFGVEIIVFYPHHQFLWIVLMVGLSSLAGLLLGIRFKMDHFRQSSAVVLLLMLLSLVLIPRSDTALNAVFNVRFLGLLLYAISHFLMAWYWQRNAKSTTNVFSLIFANTMLVIAVSVWMLMGHLELYAYLNSVLFMNASLVFVGFSCVILVWVANRLQWTQLHWLRNAFLPYLICIALVMIANDYSFYANFGLGAWMFAMLVNYWILRKYHDHEEKLTEIFHLLSLLLFSFVFAMAFSEWVGSLSGLYSLWYYSSKVLLLLMISIVLFRVRKINHWPIANHKIAYYKWGLPLLLVTIWSLTVILNASIPGQLSLSTYVPVFNIIDVTGIAFILLLGKSIGSKVIRFTEETKKFSAIILAATAFLFINASLLRCFHYWFGIEYRWSVLSKSFMVQSGMSILWALTAVILMVLAAHKHARTLWLVGLGLMIAVVIKLFLVDMSASGTVERIIAFLTVGVLLSLVGYFSPLPPSIEKQQE